MVDSQPPQLQAMRRTIADSSGGTSSSQLRTMAVTLIRKLDLRGAVADVGAGKGDLIRSLLEMDRFSSSSAWNLTERPSDLPTCVRWFSTDLNQQVPCDASSFDLVTSLGLMADNGDVQSHHTGQH